jgi:hypothetical protein
VRYWEFWNIAVKGAKRQGHWPLGITWVVLRYKPSEELPRLREEINSVYLECLQEFAEEYRLAVCLDLASNKVMLYDPLRIPAGWLDTMTVPQPNA